MNARFLAGAMGLVFLLLAIAGMPDIGDTLELFSAGGGINAMHLLIGVVLSMAAFSAPRAHPQLVLAAVVYGVVALLGLNRAVSANWPDLFGTDGRWMSASLGLALALAAMIARDRDVLVEPPASTAEKTEVAEPKAGRRKPSGNGAETGKAKPSS